MKTKTLFFSLFFTVALFASPFTPEQALDSVQEFIETSGWSSADSATTADAEPDNDAICIVAEQMPEFPGGQQALFKYLSENVKYPAVAQKNGIQGRVICRFVVDKDGSITDIEVLRSSGDASLDNEAVRVIKSMPKWIPGMNKGKPVRVQYSVPINFRL